MKKLFVWDLHGTLEQGNHLAVVSISNEVLRCFGHAERFTDEDGMALYGKKWYEYFTWLLGEDAYEQAMRLQEACFELSEINPEMQCDGIEPTPHAIEVLSAIDGKHHQILISNTRPATLETFLKVLSLDEFFPSGRAFAVDQHSRDARRTKAQVLAEFLGDAHDYDDIVIVGDSPSDMRLKEVSGGSCYLFAHPEFEFRECESDYRIRDLRRLLPAV
ncbi:HAD family hydrolase [Nonomuraea guangzhouensis]|uniref:HAD family hydrolase n=1 Tax=Nonomuraea guangzhouensis TaxID=1291555 RepID=A0ABW4GHE3_9ACTN|nr:HAD family hydrolase [Nonomuraea guangzhouensis]